VVAKASWVWRDDRRKRSAVVSKPMERFAVKLIKVLYPFSFILHVGFDIPGGNIFSLVYRTNDTNMLLTGLGLNLHYK